MAEKNIVQEIVIQQLVNEIEGVVSSKVKQNDKGDVVEIHVLADKSRNAKQIVRDIQSAVTAKFDVDIDHRIISIAQLDCGKFLNKEFRLVYKGMELISKGLEIEAKIILSHNGKDYCGYQKGVNTRNNLNRLVVQATLEAVGEFLNFKDAFLMEGIKDLTLADEKVVNVAVTYIDKDGQELLIGSTVVKGDLKEAVVKATLDAANRKISKLMRK